MEYLDENGNGFLDCIKYDLDGDREYEFETSLHELGLDDSCEVIDVSKMKYKDYTRLFKKVSDGMWKRARDARKVAGKYGLELHWYSKLMDAHSLRERYNNGWWLQFYIYKDLEDKFVREHDIESLKSLNRAYYSGSWKEMM